MRLVFGVLSLLIVTLIVASLAKKQLQAINAPMREGITGAGVPATSGTPAQQSQQLQRKVADDLDKLMQQAPARADGAAQ